MDRMLLVTTANGMFGRAVVEALAGDPRARVRAMVRDAGKFTVSASNVEVVTADLDDSASLPPAVAGVSHVFLCTPMDDHIRERECRVIDAAAAGGAPHVLKLHGAVRHGDDILAQQHGAVLDHLTASGLAWTLISPNSVMETSLRSFAETIRMDCIIGMSGHGKIGMVALEDVAAVAAAAVLGENDLDGENLLVTGPAAIDMFEVAAAFSEVLGRRIEYYDLPEGEFAKMVLEHSPGMTPEELDISVLDHLRAWRAGGADLVTQTVAEMTGHPPISVKGWISAHREQFDLPRKPSDRLVAKMLRMKYGHAKAAT